MTQAENTSSPRLERSRHTDSNHCDEIFAMVYAELRRIAGRHFRKHQGGHTLQPTAIVHEAFLKLANRGAATARDRDHFVAIAATAMRQVLVDHARGKLAGKRGGPGRAPLDGDDRHGTPRRVPLSDSIEGRDRAMSLEDLLSLDEALDRLSKLDKTGRKVRVVEIRFFGGLSVDEVARLLDVSPETVKKDWLFTKRWLRQAIDGNPP